MNAMIFPITTKTNKSGHLEIGGIDVLALEKKFGTPLYVVDEKTIRNNIQEYKKAFQKYHDFRMIYASKALCVKSILKIMDSEAVGIDISSSGELFTAIKAGCNPKTIYFHGNNKSEDEITQGIKSKIGYFVVDNFDELDLLAKTARKLNSKVNILLRVNPGIEAHTHDFIKTGIIDSKFGFAKGEVLQAVVFALKKENLNFMGLHSHIGSQIFDSKPYAAEIDELLKIALEIKKLFCVDCKEINIGGGIGILYTEKDATPNIKLFADKVISSVKNLSKKYGLRLPKIVIEPGRSLVGRAGVTLYKVGTIKKIPDIRTYVLVDGGMADNIRPIIYGAKYSAVIANKAKLKPKEKVTIAGRFCESGDVLIKDILLPKVEKGDIIAVACTGAYNYSMASNYNRVSRPAMVLVNKGKAKIIVRRESCEDIIRNDL